MFRRQGKNINICLALIALNLLTGLAVLRLLDGAHALRAQRSPRFLDRRTFPGILEYCPEI